MIYSKAELDLNNIESAYTALEMAKTIRKFPFEFGNFDKPDAPADSEKRIEGIIEDLRTLIVETLSNTVKFSWSTNHRGDMLNMKGSSGSYPDFSKRLKNIDDCAILTFNYDLGLDVSLALSQLKPVYHTSENESARVSDGKPLSVLKLHGSLNWARTGDSIEPLNLYNYVTRKGIPMISIGSNSQTVKLDLDEVAQYNEEDWHGEPVIVPPSWSKSGYQTALTNVWQRAAKELSEARSIYIIGYSLPDTDVFFKLLFGLGTASSEPLQKIVVYNPDPNTEAHFRAMLGPGTEQRYTFEPMKFDEAVIDIFGEIPWSPPIPIFGM